MFNPQRLDTIREKIKLSTLLSDHEKSDWLNLLELMNDKQLGELEEILAAESPSQPKPPISTQPKAQRLPDPEPPITPPSAFAELETLSTQPQQPIASLSRSAPPRSAPSPQSAPPPTMPRPSSQPSPSTPQAPTRPVQPPSISKMPPLSHIANIPADVDMSFGAGDPFAKSNAKSQPKASYAKAQTQPASSSIAPVAPKPDFVIQNLDEIENISLETIRQYDLQSIVNVILSAIADNGYFNIIQLVEASPLYATYIQSGKLMLQNQQSTLTQAEFEFITDLLRNMRF